MGNYHNTQIMLWIYTENRVYGERSAHRHIYEILVSTMHEIRLLCFERLMWKTSKGKKQKKTCVGKISEWLTRWKKRKYMRD